MKERVGECIRCQKIIYCLDGFLNGHISDDGSLYCFSCEKQGEDENNEGNEFEREN